MLPKLIAIVVVVFLLFFMITAPHQAHDIVAGAGHLIAKVARSTRDFVKGFD